MFTDLIGAKGYNNHEEIPLTVILPAFITSELKTAFQIGFLWKNFFFENTLFK